MLLACYGFSMYTQLWQKLFIQLYALKLEQYNLRTSVFPFTRILCYINTYFILNHVYNLLIFILLHLLRFKFDIAYGQVMFTNMYNIYISIWTCIYLWLVRICDRICMYVRVRKYVCDNYPEVGCELVAIWLTLRRVQCYMLCLHVGMETGFWLFRK